MKYFCLINTKKVMKKIMMIAAMMVAAVSAHAQFEPGTFSLQPKLGATVSFLSNMPKLPVSSHTDLDKSPIVGFTIGGEAEYQLTSMLSLAAGVNYSMQGSGWSDYEYKAGSDSYKLNDAKVSLGYVTVPVVANIYLFKGFAIKGGVQFGLLTNANMEYTLKGSFENVNVNQNYDESIMDDCEKFDISIPMGVSYQVPTIPVVIDGRFNLGLNKVFKEKVADKDPKNMVFQVTVGYKFAL